MNNVTKNRLATVLTKTQSKLPYVPNTIGLHAKTMLDTVLMELFTKDMQPFTTLFQFFFKFLIPYINFPTENIPQMPYYQNSMKSNTKKLSTRQKFTIGYSNYRLLDINHHRKFYGNHHSLMKNLSQDRFCINAAHRSDNLAKE